jgi:hypothetical protein
MGCSHRCTFCYVRSFEQRADRPAGHIRQLDPRPVNVVAVLRRELARRSWRGEEVVISAATDRTSRPKVGTDDAWLPRPSSPPPTLPPDHALAAHRPRCRPARRGGLPADLSVTFSSTLDQRSGARPNQTAPPHQRLRALRSSSMRAFASVGMAPIAGIRPPQPLAAVVAAAREAGACGI